MDVGNALAIAGSNRATEVPAETSAKNEGFKKIYDDWFKFREDQILWFRVTEQTFDNFMAGSKGAKK